jgi:hypothetical protein
MVIGFGLELRNLAPGAPAARTVVTLGFLIPCSVLLGVVTCMVVEPRLFTSRLLVELGESAWVWITVAIPLWWVPWSVVLESGVSPANPLGFGLLLAACLSISVMILQSTRVGLCGLAVSQWYALQIIKPDELLHLLKPEIERIRDWIQGLKVWEELTRPGKFGQKKVVIELALADAAAQRRQKYPVLRWFARFLIGAVVLLSLIEVAFEDLVWEPYIIPALQSRGGFPHK